MTKQHEVESLAFDGDWMTLGIDQRVYRLPLAQVSKQGYQLKPGQVDCARDWSVVTKKTV